MATQENEGFVGWGPFSNPANWAITDKIQEEVLPQLTNFGSTTNPSTGRTSYTPVAGLSNDGSPSFVTYDPNKIAAMRSDTNALGGDTTTASQVTSGGTTGGGSSFDRAGAISQINERAKAADKVFKTLFEGIDRVLNEQTNFLAGNQAQVQQGLEQSRQQEARTLRNQFASRGLTDSSYRARAVGDVNREADRLGQAEQQAYQNELAGLSRQANSATTGARTQLQSLQSQLGSLADYTDQELVDFKNQIDDIIATRQQDVAQTTTNRAELANFDAETRVPGLTQRIQTIAQSAFAPEVKEQLISGLITNSGLGQDEQDLLANRFLAPIA